MEAEQEQARAQPEAINNNPHNVKGAETGSKTLWVQIFVYSILLLFSGASGTILGRIYFINGGKSKWLATFVTVAGFPITLPFQWFHRTRTEEENPHRKTIRFAVVLSSIYVALGVFTAAYCICFTIGLQYLPLTTYSLICASQLGFNAVFSFFFNGHKFTPYIINSVLLLTISSVLLVFQSDSKDTSNSSNHRYLIGFVCTVAGSASSALFLSMTGLVFDRIIKKESSIKSIIDMSNYINLVASVVILIGLFASGDWTRLHEEMRDYKKGSVSYVLNLFWTAVSWQCYTIGCVGLVFEVSPLFSNVIGMLGLPIVPIVAMVVLQEKITGLKVVSMILGMWGFMSYMYQHYLDDMEMKKRVASSSEETSDLLGVKD